MAELIIKRIGVTVATVKIDDKTVLIKKLMNEDKVTSQFFHPSKLPIELGDYIEVAGKNYYLNKLPSVEKVKNGTFKYSVAFESVLYDMYNKMLISIDGLSDFAYTGNASEMVALIVSNMNEITSGWVVGTIDSSERKTTTFTNETCRTALTKVYQLFNMEFEIVGKTINMIDAIGNATAYTFEYGRDNGLYSIEQRPVESKRVYTKVYGFGGEKNIPHDYRDRQKKLVFEERYLERNTSLYGIREGHFTDDDIYPKRTGTLTAINVVIGESGWDSNNSYVEDSSMDFDLNEYLMEGIEAKIVFKTGDLSGIEYVIWDYDATNKRFKFNSFGDSDGFVSPNANIKPAVGDTYTLVNIKMPGSYVRDAELLLKEETQRYLDANSVPKSLYFVKIDAKYAKENSISIDAGDLVTIKDVNLGIDSAIRISQVSYPLVNPFEISATIADFVPYTLREMVAKNAVTSNKIINTIINQINKTENISNKTEISNKTVNITNEYPEKDIVVINGRPFRFKKGFDNDTNFEILESGDFITGNYWNRLLYVKLWKYTGGDKWDIANWIQIESLDVTTNKSLFLNVQREIVSSETLVESDRKILITFDSASAINCTIDDVWNANVYIEFYNKGAGTVSFVQGTATLTSDDGLDLEQGKVATLFNVGTAYDELKLKGELS